MQHRLRLEDWAEDLPEPPPPPNIASGLPPSPPSSSSSPQLSLHQQQYASSQQCEQCARLPLAACAAHHLASSARGRSENVEFRAIHTRFSSLAMRACFSSASSKWRLPRNRFSIEIGGSMMFSKSSCSPSRFSSFSESPAPWGLLHATRHYSGCLRTEQHRGPEVVRPRVSPSRSVRLMP